MNGKQCLIICSLLLFALLTCKVAFGQELDTEACTGIEIVDGTPTSYINQECLMRLYDAKLAQVTSTDSDFSREKPKTKLCRVVKKIIYGSSSLLRVYSISGWVTEPAECLDEDNEKDLSLPSITFDTTTSCMVQQDRLGRCAPEECQPTETNLRKYRT